MSDYYNYGSTLIPGSVAKAEEVAAELQGVQAAFELLPTPRPAGDGFMVPFYVANGTHPSHAANFGQLQTLEAQALQSKTDAEAADSNIQNVLLPDITTKHGQVNTWNTETQGWRNESLSFRNEAEQWAVSLTEIEPEIYGAKYYADLAAQLTSGARVYVGGWDASGGTMPIATPTALDAGKFWRITVAGTLPVVGAVAIEDELSIRQDLSYEVLPSNAAVQSVNGSTGNVVITKATISLGNVPNYSATDSLIDGSSSKFATAKAASDLKSLVDAAQSDADTGIANAATAQSSANAAQLTANNAQSTADAASPSTHTHTPAEIGAATAGHDHDGAYKPAISDADLKSALNAAPTNWALKWSSAGSNNVTNSWGDGEYLIKMLPGVVRITVAGALATYSTTAINPSEAAYSYYVFMSGGVFKGYLSGIQTAITHIYKAE